MSISWHDPDLYSSLCLLIGLATLMAIIQEFAGGNRASGKGHQAARWSPAWSPTGNENLRPPSCSRARFRRVGLARVAAGVHINLAAIRDSWRRMSLPRVRLQRRTGLAGSIWSVLVTR